MDTTPQPGQLIVPHNPDERKPAGNGAPEPERPVEQPQPTAPSPAPESEPAAAAQPAAIAPPAPQPAAVVPLPPVESPSVPAAAGPVAEDSAGWAFRQESTGNAAGPEPDLPDANLGWSASEFVAHEKSAGWYALLVAGALVVTALVYVVTRDKISAAVVLLAAAAFGFFASRQPRTQQYSLSRRGLQIGQKIYHLQDFKTFSLSEEGAIISIIFTPLRRFMPALTIYVAPDIEERVVNFLSAYLPFEQHKNDAVDSLLKRIRF